MEAKARPIGQLLEDRARFCVPVYQRHYEWERKEQWEPLWSDIQDKTEEILSGAARNYAHYMGALILSEGKAKHGQVPIKQVIDGQQRLTTIQLVINALYRTASERGEAKQAAFLESHLLNDKLHLTDDPNTEKHKLWPTKYDRVLYTDVVMLSFAALNDKYHYFYYKNGKLITSQAPRLLSGLHFFYEAIQAFIDEPDTEGWVRRLSALSEALLDHFSIVVISIDEKDDAQTIFSTLNARGKPLNAMDLIRNDIFQRAASTKEDAEKLFDDKWSEFEDPFWDTPEVQGRLTRKRIESFLGSVLAAERAETINLSKLYPEYRTYAEQAAYPTVDAELSRLLSYVPAYRGLKLPEPQKPLGQIARHLSDWDMTTAFPLVMSVEIEMKIRQDEVRELYRTLESYTIRRAYCALTPKGYNNLFLAAIKFLRENGWSADNFSAFLLSQTGEASRFPTDAEFRNAVITQPIYKPGWERRSRVILQTLEQTLRTSKDDVITIQAGFTVEHVMPSKWAENWALPDGTKAPSEDVYTALVTHKCGEATTDAIRLREGVKNTLGNLTLVTQPLNSAISHGAFAVKKPELARSALLLNRMIAEQTVWGEEQIEARGVALAEKACTYWGRPVLAN
jgi:uncharacterized protein with ParB-like and HNH nuclease domain